MLNDQERKWIYRHAYLPEQLPDYVEAVSGAEPFLHRNYLYFFSKSHLIFNGYPLKPGSDSTGEIYEYICERLQPNTVAAIASTIWLPAGQYEKQAADSYFRLNLPLTSIGATEAYMLRRAQRDLKVTRGSFGREHKKIIKVFVAGRRFTSQQKSVFKHIPQYLKASKSAVLFEARKKKELVAFSIVDLGAADYAFYLFNFRSKKKYIPGGSDLLFYQMVNLAHSEGKKFLNLGLGVNPGIRRFKEKWGGEPFLNYVSVFVDKREVDIKKLASKL